MGCASARFHRPTSGQGLNETALAVIRGMRELSGRMDFFDAAPRNDLLLSREPGEAYCRAIPGREYAVYFPSGGAVEIDLTGFSQDPAVQWLDLLASEWHQPLKLERSVVTLETPDDGHWIALIKFRHSFNVSTK